MKTLTDQLAACGFSPLAADGTARHACGLSVHFGGPARLILTLLGRPAPDGAPVALVTPDELEWFCRSHGLFTPFATVHAALAPWPGEAAVPGVCYRDGDIIRARTERGDATVALCTEGVVAQLDGRPWPEPQTHPSGDARHGSISAFTPGGVLGVYDVQGGQNGEMQGMLTLTCGQSHATVAFTDDDVEREVWLHAPNLSSWVPASNAAEVLALLRNTAP